VYVAVSDTGVGYTGDLEEILYKSVGLSNISKRLKLLYNQSLQVELQQEGLRFSFTIPLK
jgi:LytS/YehU family sensor histidine kinase